MAQRFLSLIATCAVIAALIFVAAPWFAFRALRADARDQDIQGLAELVDYPAVRGGLGVQLGPVAGKAPPTPNPLRDPIGAVRQALSPIRAPAPRVDAYVSPDGIYALANGYAPGRGPPPPSGLDGPRDQLRAALENWPRLRYWGANRVRFAVRARDRPGHEVLFTFQRRGLFTWKLVQIRPPAPAR